MSDSIELRRVSSFETQGEDDTRLFSLSTANGEDDQDENLVQRYDDDSGGVQGRKRVGVLRSCLARRTGLELVLMFACMILLGLYYGHGSVSSNYGADKSNQKNETMSSTTITSPSEPGGGGPPQDRALICESEACVHVADSLLYAMNLTVDPCENFYDYVCQKWEDRNSIPADGSGVSVLSLISSENQDILRKVLERGKGRNTSLAHEQKVMHFYEACLDMDRIDSVGARPLERFYNEEMSLSRWNPSRDDSKWDSSDWKYFLQTMAEFHRYSIGAMFDFSLSADRQDPVNYAFSISQSSLSLPSRRDYIDKDLATDKSLLGLKRHILSLLSLFEKNSDLASLGDRAESIIAFEMKLALIMAAPEDFRDPVKTYNRLSLHKFGKLAPSMDLEKYITLVMGEYYAVAGITFVITPFPSFFTDLEGLLSETNKNVVKDYLTYRFVDSFAHHLSTPYIEANFNFSKALYGVKSKPERWETCVGRSDVYFGHMLGRLYLDKTFSPESKQLAEDMIRRIRASFQSTLESVSWMDSHTRKRALNKLEEMGEKIGYPDFVMDNNQLEEYYAMFKVKRDDYFATILSGRMFLLNLMLSKAGKRVDKSEWHMAPFTVNAYYSLTSNEIVFPAGILQPPLFHKDHVQAINFGGLGSIVGHEMTHGFDDNGAYYDETGTMKTWWEKETFDTFRKRTTCMSNQYANYVVDGEHINGNLTLGENLADNGGLKLAYNAYQSWLKSADLAHSQQRLPGLAHLSPDQLFFVSFAHTWCSKRRSQSLHESMYNDP